MSSRARIWLKLVLMVATVAAVAAGWLVRPAPGAVLSAAATRFLE